jgi:nitronate monooxygenase
MPHASSAGATPWQPYFREFGLDPAAIPAGPGRVPFDARIADLIEPFSRPW